MTTDILINLVPWMFAFTLAMVFFVSWQRERRIDRELRANQLEREAKLREEERSDAQYEKYTQERKQEEAEIRANAGGGSGGYIVVDLPDAQRRLFHDLLKGFEEYARLKGYGVSFSVDSTFNDRIAFKFTLTDPDVIVGNDRVRNDLKEYLEKVSNGDPLDDIPQVISIEEHEVLVATLKNRISFLQHSYNLAKNSVEFYESLIRKVGSQNFLPSQNIVLQTGGAYTAPNYTAIGSPQALLGNGNRANNSIRIAASYPERKIQIDHIAELLSKLQLEQQNPSRDEAFRSLENVKEELEHVAAPDENRVARWLQKAKEALQLRSLGHQTVQAAKVLFDAFGLN